jgi:hypothetical protein
VTALAQAVHFDGVVYPAGTDHTAMPVKITSIA